MFGRIACIVALLLLSGCAQSETPDFDEPQMTYAIEGNVLDEALRPIQFATVHVEGSNATARTNNQGAFAFAGMLDDTYTLQITHDGYNPVTLTVEPAKQSEPVKAILTPLVTLDPRVEAYPFNGFIGCHLSVYANLDSCEDSSVFSNSMLLGTSEDRLPLTPTGPPTWIQAEIAWEEGEIPTGELRAILEIKQGDSTYTLNTHGTSPIVLGMSHFRSTFCSGPCEKSTIPYGPIDNVRLFVEGYGHDLPDQECPLPSNCESGISVMTQQPFQAYVHLFYEATPQLGWTLGTNGEPQLIPYDPEAS